jgi:hypothetical protein
MITLNNEYFKQKEEIKLTTPACLDKIRLPSSLKRFQLIEDETTKRVVFFMKAKREQELIDFLNSFKGRKPNRENFNRGYCDSILKNDKEGEGNE